MKEGTGKPSLHIDATAGFYAPQPGLKAQRHSIVETCTGQGKIVWFSGGVSGKEKGNMLSPSDHGEAGRSTREMARKRYQKVYLLAGAMALIGILLISNINNLARFGLPVVIVVVLVVKIVVDLLHQKSLNVKKRAKDADRGAAAEEKVAVNLLDLPECYHAFHDIDFEGFNVDHAVVGPAGIFLIETKSHKGKITSEGDSLLLNGVPPEKNFLNQTWSQTKNLEQFLYKMTSKEWKVKPLICFTNAYVDVRKPVKGITVTSLRYLGRYLSKQPEILQADEVERICKIISSWLSRHERGGKSCRFDGTPRL